MATRRLSFSPPSSRSSATSRKTELGQTITTLESTISTTDAMLYNASGLFESIGTTFATPNGQTITRQTAPFKPIAAVQTAAMLNLPRPKQDGEKPTIRNAPATEELKAFVQSLAERAERLKTQRVDPSQDNMLKITSEGRKAALDLRLMRPAAPDDPQGKVSLAVENIHRIWQAITTERSAQPVFCELSAPKDRGFSVYRDMAEKLERLGISTKEVAFIQDFDSELPNSVSFATCVLAKSASCSAARKRWVRERTCRKD